MKRTLPLATMMALVSSVAICGGGFSADTDRCHDRADAVLLEVSSWSQLREWFEAFPQCDDGYLGEGVSDYVASHLAKQWKDLLLLERQFQKNPKFKTFVLQHVDATANHHDLRAIITNASSRCPSPMLALCAELSSAARAALDDAKTLDPEANYEP